jgi:hypothetical protein
MAGEFESLEKRRRPEWFAACERLRNRCLRPMMKNSRWSVFFRLDLESTAHAFAEGSVGDKGLPELPFTDHDDPMQLVQQRQWQEFKANAFARLRDLIVDEAHLSRAIPRKRPIEDQIVWATDVELKDSATTVSPMSE